MSQVKRLARTVLRPVIRHVAQRRVSAIQRVNVPAAKAIAAALDEVLANKLTPEESAFVDRIEALRSRLADDTTPLSIVDFGSGAAAAGRTAEEIAAGIPRTVTVAQACRSSKPPFWCLLLFKLVRELRPRVGIELGTCLGISASYQAAAMQLNGHGEFATLEGAPALAAASEANLRSLDLTGASVVTGRFSDTLEPTLQARAPVDYAFIDGHHDEQATIAYYKQFLPHLADDAVLVFDDISWSPGMRRAWQYLENDQHVALAISLRKVGICVVSRNAHGKKQHVTLRMPA